MQFDKVNFRKYSIDPKGLIDCVPEGAPIFWDDDWTVFFVTNTQSEIRKWCNENVLGQFDIVITNGGLYIAFEDRTEAVLFKLSIMENT